ncbi:MAG: hypothetical protein ACRELA_18170 [Candidatus Rokuibacteriota bacterium]
MARGKWASLLVNLALGLGAVRLVLVPPVSPRDVVYSLVVGLWGLSVALALSHAAAEPHGRRSPASLADRTYVRQLATAYRGGAVLFALPVIFGVLGDIRDGTSGAWKLSWLFAFPTVLVSLACLAIGSALRRTETL